MSGISRFSVATRRGAKYFAVETTPRVTRPAWPAFSAPTWATQLGERDLDAARRLERDLRLGRRGRAGAGLGAAQHRRGERRLEVADLRVHRRRCEPEPVGGGGDRAGLGDRGEGAELAEGDGVEAGQFEKPECGVRKSKFT